MKAYSQDVREHALRTVDDGYPRAEIVQMFGISLSTRVSVCESTTRGRTCAAQNDSWSPSIEPSTGGGGRASSIAGECRRHRWRQHCEMWKQTHGEDVSRWTMSRAVIRLGWTRKKSHWERRSATKRSAPASDRPPGVY